MREAVRLRSPLCAVGSPNRSVGTAAPAEVLRLVHRPFVGGFRVGPFFLCVLGMPPAARMRVQQRGGRSQIGAPFSRPFSHWSVSCLRLFGRRFARSTKIWARSPQMVPPARVGGPLLQRRPCLRMKLRRRATLQTWYSTKSATWPCPCWESCAGRWVCWAVIIRRGLFHTGW